MNDRVKRLTLIGLGLLLPQWAMALTVTTIVEPGQVRSGESVVVTYEVSGQASQPDFTPLQKDFEIIDQRQSQNISLINGQAAYEMVWSLVLMPRATGELSLPAIDFGGVTSDSRTVRVVDETSGAGGTSAPSTSQSADPSGNIRIEYRVDDPTPYANQQVLLTTKVYTAVDVEDLVVSDPEVIAGEADIDRLGRSRRYESMREGRQYTVREQRYTLVPRSTGVLELSPIEVTGRVGGAPMTRRADPPRLEVVPAKADGTRNEQSLAPDDLFVELDVDKDSPYVQEQVMFTVRLFRAVPIENATLSAPSVSGGDAVIERIGNDRQFQATRDGRRYSVNERRFVLFPQTSGTLTLEPVRLQASVPVAHGGSSTTGFWTRPLTRAVRIESEAYELAVQPPPANGSRPWLPAASLTLEEQWPERDAFEVGAPITRRITVTAEEMLASQLPALDVPLPEAVKSYPEKPRRDTGAGAHGATAHLEQTVTLIPSRAGTFTVPEFELHWWNTKEDRPETLRLPAHTFEVTTAAGDPITESGAEAPVVDTTGSETVERPGIAWWVSMGLGFAWLATLVLWWRDRRTRATGSAGDEAAAGETRRQAEKRLRVACGGGDPETVRDALLAWGRAHWPDEPPRSLGALSARIDDDDVKTEIAMLQRALYAPGGAAWRGDGLYRSVVACKPGKPGEDRGEALKPLYQH